MLAIFAGHPSALSTLPKSATNAENLQNEKKELA